MISIYFVGTYKPIMCGIADYTSFITRELPAVRWGVLSFDLEEYGAPLVADNEPVSGRVWYGIPSRQEFSATVIRQGLKELDADTDDTVLWFQHEFGIWPDSRKFAAMLKDLNVRKVVSFHTLHFQSPETPSGLRRGQYNLLRALLPYVEAITVFSHGVHRAVTTAFPEHRDKVHVVKHGVHSYPGISRLSRREAKKKLNDYLFRESDLDREIKETLHRQRIFLDPGTIVIGQTGFLSASKGSELLYSVRDYLQQLIPKQRIAAVRIGLPRDESQKIYAKRLRKKQISKDKFFIEVWLPKYILPLAQRAFDVNFHWPSDCTQSGILAHALGVNAVVAGRDLEGVGEVLKESGGLVDADWKHLLLKVRDLILNPESEERQEGAVRKYAAEYSWAKQARRHGELAEHLMSLPVDRPVQGHV